MNISSTAALALGLLQTLLGLDVAEQVRIGHLEGLLLLVGHEIMNGLRVAFAHFHQMLRQRSVRSPTGHIFGKVTALTSNERGVLVESLEQAENLFQLLGRHFFAVREIL